MRTLHFSIIVLLVVVTARCASTGEMASDEPTSPVSGMWDYSIDAPQGLFTGNLEMIPQEDGLAVHILQEGQQADDALMADSVAFDEETQMLTFSFENPEYGMMNVTLTLDDQGVLNGVLHAVQYTVDAPMVVTRSEQQ
ncbi:MAG: hypothetical protein OXF06_07590 [Bacteroidetes bacterium]|nr:hypothetical protein [Bacteroidota bacterium]